MFCWNFCPRLKSVLGSHVSHWWNVRYTYWASCVEPVKEQAEKGYGKVFSKGKGFKEFDEMVTVVDVRWDCYSKRLYEVGDVVWELIGGPIGELIGEHVDSTDWRRNGKGSIEGIKIFGRSKKSGACEDNYGVRWFLVL